MKAAEELVFQLCRRSFLRLWSYANPRGKHGKELCDALVVFDQDIVIFSVKEIALRRSGNPTLGRERWARAAVEESHPQIWGTVLGIATERPQRGGGFSLDALRLTIDDWTDEHQLQAEEGQGLFGWFANSVYSQNPEDEYPGR